MRGAIEFGLALSSEELAELTALICSGIPAGLECRATWVRPDSRTCAISVDNPDVKYSQKFVRTREGLKVDQDLFVLPDDSRHCGHAKRLMRNLVLVYDLLGVRLASVYADHVEGAYTWAKLGARAIDPQLQRRELSKRVAENARQWGISPEYSAAIEEALAAARDSELMYRAASLTGEDGTNFGRDLLVGHKWEGYWDLHDPELRALLRETIK